MNKKKNNFVINTLLVSISMILALTLCEYIVRITNLAPMLIRIRTGKDNSPYKASNNPILGYELREGAKFFGQLHPESSRINSHGQWDIERSIKKPLGSKRIIVLGDSVIVAADVLDINNTITRQLEKKLHQNNIEVLNFGVTGYCTLAEVELLKKKGLKYKPDLVILNFVWNDYNNFNNDMGRISFKRPSLVRYLFIKSALFRFIALRTNMYYFENEQALKTNIPEELLLAVDYKILDKIKYSSPESMTGKHLIAIGKNNVLKGLQVLKQLSIEYNFQIFIVVWPHFDEKSVVNVEGYDRNNINIIEPTSPLVIEQIAKDYEIPVFRLSKYFTKDYELKVKNSKNFTISPNKYYTIGDHMHPTFIGCKVAAESLKMIVENEIEF